MVQYTCYNGIILRTRSASLILHLILKVLENYQISCMQFKIRCQRSNDLLLSCFIISAFPLPFPSTAVISSLFLSTFRLFPFHFPFPAPLCAFFPLYRNSASSYGSADLLRVLYLASFSTKS